jgi:hypothetical protein
MIGTAKQLGFLSLVLFAAAAACQREPGPIGASTTGAGDDSVLIQAELTGVPTNAKCVRFTTVASTRTFQQSFMVTPGDGGLAPLNLTGLPYNQALSITAEAFNVSACTSVTATTPVTYASDPVSAGPLPPGGSQALSFVLKPTANATGSVDFLYLTISQTSVTFQPTVIAQTSPIVTFTVANIGAVATSQLITTITSGPPSQFNVLPASNCNAVLGVGGSCTVQVVFQPTAAGNQSGTLQVSAAQGGTVSASLSGQGQNPAKLVVTPNSHDYGSQALTSTTAFTFAVSNSNGGNEQPANGIMPMLSQPDYVVLQNLCQGVSLTGGGASCNVVIGFSPVATGTRGGMLTVSGNPGMAGTATLTGVGISPLTVMPTSATFGMATVGTMGGSQTFMFKNNGTVVSAPLSVVSAPNNVFRPVTGVTDTCTNRQVNPGATCNITLQFFPNAPGLLMGTLTATAQSGWSAVSMFSGTGL